MTAPTAPLPSREVTDAELDEAASKARRHAWRERLSMGAGMLFGLAGLAGWVYSGIVFVFAGGIVLGATIYGALRPKHDLFDQPMDDAEARAEMSAQKRRGWMAWLAVHLGHTMVARASIFLGLVAGLATGWALTAATGVALQTTLTAGAIGGVATGALGGWFLGRRLARHLERKIQGA